MNKSKNISGHPIIKQVLNFISPKDIYRTAEKHQSDVLKGVGRNLITGKKKGGIKMHTMINAM